MRTDSRLVVYGYVVQFSGRVAQRWVFFADLEPAVAFGCAARMSLDVADYSVFVAAREVMFDECRGDITTLHLTGERVDRRPDERAVLSNWVTGVHPDGSHFRSPVHR